MEREIITTALNIYNANNSGNNSGSSPNVLLQKQQQQQQMAALFQQQQPQQPPIIPPIQVSPLLSQNPKPAPIPIPPASALSPLPPTQAGDFNQHLLFQHQGGKQLRVSPLPPGKSQKFPQ
jgi:hypothetical protein